MARQSTIGLLFIFVALIALLFIFLTLIMPMPAFAQSIPLLDSSLAIDLPAGAGLFITGSR
jgi:hypothetical protein